jgi:hypothetical protein
VLVGIGTIEQLQDLLQLVDFDFVDLPNAIDQGMDFCREREKEFIYGAESTRGVSTNQSDQWIYASA